MKKPPQGPNANECADFFHKHVEICQKQGYRNGYNDGRAAAQSGNAEPLTREERFHHARPAGSFHSGQMVYSLTEVEAIIKRRLEKS